MDIRIAYVNLRGPLNVVVREDWRREDEGRARRVCSELGAQSRPPDIIGGGAVRESLSITGGEKDEKVVPGLKTAIHVCIYRDTSQVPKAPRIVPGVLGSLHKFRLKINTRRIRETEL